MVSYSTKAVKFDGNMIEGKDHCEIVLQYMKDFGITEADMDRRIEEGRVKFGFSYDGEWSSSEWRDRDYVHLKRLKENIGEY